MFTSAWEAAGSGEKIEHKEIESGKKLWVETMGKANSTSRRRKKRGGHHSIK